MIVAIAFDDYRHLVAIISGAGAASKAESRRHLSPRALARRLAAHANSSRREHLLIRLKAHGKPEIEPNGVGDNLRGKTATGLEGITNSRHAPPFSAFPLRVR